MFRKGLIVWIMLTKKWRNWHWCICQNRL